MSFLEQEVLKLTVRVDSLEKRLSEVESVPPIRRAKETFAERIGEEWLSLSQCTALCQTVTSSDRRVALESLCHEGVLEKRTVRPSRGPSRIEYRKIS